MASVKASCNARSDSPVTLIGDMQHRPSIQVRYHRYIVMSFAKRRLIHPKAFRRRLCPPRQTSAYGTLQDTVA
jgi:hypothetical protein